MYNYHFEITWRRNDKTQNHLSIGYMSDLTHFLCKSYNALTLKKLIMVVGRDLLMEKLLSSSAEFLNVKLLLLLQITRSTTAAATPAAATRRRIVMTMPAIAPPLRLLFVLSDCPPCDGSITLAVVASTAAELSAFDEDVSESLAVIDMVTVGR